MRIITEKQIKKFQQGGAMPAEAVPAGAPAPEAAPAPAQQDPIAMLAEMSIQALETQDCQIAMQVCEGFVALLQQMQGGAAAPAPQEPVFRKGGKIVGRM
jgi:hypothetical protein